MQKYFTKQCSQNNDALKARCFSDVSEGSSKKVEETKKTKTEKSLEDDKNLGATGKNITFDPGVPADLSAESEGAAVVEPIVGSNEVNYKFNVHGPSLDDSDYNLSSIINSLILLIPEMEEAPPENKPKFEQISTKLEDKALKFKFQQIELAS